MYRSTLKILPHLNVLKNCQTDYVSRIFGKYYIFELNNWTNNDEISLRIDKINSDGFLNTNLMATKKPIGGIDIILNYNEKKIVIDWHFVNDYFFASTHNNVYGNPINKNEKNDVLNLLFGLSENIGKDNNFDKIETEVHCNLNLFKNNGLDVFGFIVSEKRSKFNHCNVIIEKKLNY